ncbi:DUF427 domain-containing protein [Tabrizicola sp. BL-A-41-H6]|uniref:DUF427 domain-containing protein n=1 Tax=Tabrizicola sp. BL-A-41-H6 TaxID=3421107 RepID=UPI003D66D7F6
MADHIKITPAAGSVTVAAGGTTLGTTDRALELKEGSYPPVLYIPRADIDMSKLEKTTRASTCPWKGAASYYSIHTDAGVLDNAVWSYESPIGDMTAIAGHLAFYPNKVTLTLR